MKQLRFFLVVPMFLATLTGLVLGDFYMWTGAVLSLIGVVGGDELLGKDDGSPEHYRAPWMFEPLFYISLLLTALLLLALMWMAGSGDLFHIGSLVEQTLGWDMHQARAMTGPLDWVGGILSTVLTLGVGTTNIAHELMHRCGSPCAHWAARWLLVVSWDAPLTLSHVHGHHRLVGTWEDHTTARRGECSYAFVLRSTIDGNFNAWRIEARRLRVLGYGTWSWRNRVLQGHAMSLLMAAAFFATAGLFGALLFVACALLTKGLLELVNYIEHYGLLRAPGTAIALRHSWDCDCKISSWLLCNLTRHAHHHVEPAKPFWELRTDQNCPKLPHGYLTCILIALIPPLWHAMMTPRLQAWDRRFATPQERELGIEANYRSGLSRFNRRDVQVR